MMGVNLLQLHPEREMLGGKAFFCGALAGGGAQPIGSRMAAAAAVDIAYW